MVRALANVLNDRIVSMPYTERSMVRRAWAVVMGSLFLFACTDDPFANLDAPAEFFSKETIGSSSDYGVFKFKYDHVITVHGFADDGATCKEITEAMNFNACKELDGQNCLDPYSCRRLN